jgi:hypothetical protein
MEAHLAAGVFFGQLLKPPRGDKVMAADLAGNATVLHAVVSHMLDRVPYIA